jgi:uncharacterized membrane protein
LSRRDTLPILDKPALPDRIATMTHANHSHGTTLSRRETRKVGRCVVTGQELPMRDLLPTALLRPALAERLREEIGNVPLDALISRTEVNRLRTQHISDLLKQERGELSTLEREVVESLSDGGILADNVEEALDDRRTLGEHLSDLLSTFGGSWSFLIAFAAFMAVWMIFNERGDAFDPFPFILLNLVLSCLAAIQAPIIMMSQKRQEAKDRQRSLNDYRVNLKAELEIRHLHEKFDHMLTRQWERLAEMQEVQIELLQELERRSASSRPE